VEPNDPSNPWSWNAFQPMKPEPGAPGVSPKIHPERPKLPQTPEMIPESDRLFKAQRDLLVGLGALDSEDYKRAEEAFEDAYRSLNAWLKRHG